jgi:hypothetical protein
MIALCPLIFCGNALHDSYLFCRAIDDEEFDGIALGRGVASLVALFIAWQNRGDPKCLRNENWPFLQAKQNR